MKKTVSKTIPAVKARPAKKVERVVTMCDFCDNKSADYYGNERTCMGCGRDICQKHQTYDPEETGDYGGHYCPTCIKLYKEKYQQLLYDLRDKHYREEEQLMNKLKKESRENS